MDFENQKMIETCFNKKQTHDLLRHELTGSKTVMDTIARSGLDQKFCLDLLSQMILNKRATVPALVGLLAHHFVDYQSTADALLRACEADLVDFDPQDERFVVRFNIDEATERLMRQYQYLPPMIVPPLTVTGNRGSGYITIRQDSLLLQDNHHEGDLCLDSINRFNAVPLAINAAVVKSIRNSWKHLDKPKAHETYDDYQKRVKAFERYERDSFFTMALLIETGNRFHLTHKVDKRGRTYAQGYHVNPQGNCWNKAVVELANKELIQ